MTQRHLAILIGHSRGLGASLGTLLAERDDRIFGFSRGSHPVLAASCGDIKEWSGDLTRPTQVAQRLEACLAGVDPGTLAGDPLAVARLTVLPQNAAPHTGTPRHG